MISVSFRLVLLLAIAAFNGSSDAAPTPKIGRKAISGRVTSCFSDKNSQPVPNIRIYVFETKRTPELTRLWNQLETMLRDSDGRDFKKVQHTDELYAQLETETVSRSVAVRPYIKTDRQGRFRVDSLKANTDYTIVAIAPEAEDDTVFRLQFVKASTDRNHQIDFDLSQGGACPKLRAQKLVFIGS
jgi:hypothetical protein